MGKSSKGRKTEKLSGAEKLKLFWASILTQKSRDLRDSLTLTGIEAQTRNAEGFTSIQLAALLNKPKSLEILLDWYKRRRILRPKGWINLRTNEGKNALMLACERGNFDICELLIFGDYPTLNVNHKDMNGLTCFDHAKRCERKGFYKKFMDLFKEEESEEETNLILNEKEEEEYKNLTTTQRNKIKKKKLKLLESGGKVTASSGSGDGEKEKETVNYDLNKLPKSKDIKWIEIKRIIESIEKLREIKEISIFRGGKDENINECDDLEPPIDPTLFLLIGINRLEMRLTNFTSFQLNTLSKMISLSVLILRNNNLNNLPNDIDKLKLLKILDLGFNQLQTLPETLNNLENLEILNLENNQLNSEIINKCLKNLKNIITLNISNNELESDLNNKFYKNKIKLINLYLSNNKINKININIIYCIQLNSYILDNNLINKIPNQICQLKKIKLFSIENNKIKNNKILKLLKEKGKLKELWKYFKKQGGLEPIEMDEEDSESESNDGGIDDDDEDEEEDGVDGEEDNGDESDTSWDSSCSFDITMEEL